MHWEMWNEAEWDLFWCGSEADYARLLEVGYRATKAACSECTVLFAGLHYWEDPTFFERVLDILNDVPDASSHNYFFDVMSVHLYSRSSDVYDLIEHIRSRMNHYVSEHQIWLTETGVPVWGDSYGWVPGLPEGNWRATTYEAASYVLQSYANAWASGVDQYFLFRAHDDWCDKDHDGDCDGSGGDGGMTEIFGLIRDDRSFRPTYSALQVATRYLVTPTMVTNWTYSSGVRRVTLWGTPHGKISVLWNTTSEALDFDYGSTLPNATRVDQRGTAESIIAVDGEYNIRLEGATAKEESSADYFIGGEPYLVIEEDTTPPSAATVHPLPSTTYSHTIPVSWEATDGEAGIWGFEIQAKSDDGIWTDWLSLGATIGVDGAGYADGEDGETYCFRARAWDRAGNLGPWSDGEACTTLAAVREVTISVERVFGDANGDGTQSGGEEPTLSDVSFRLVNESGQDVVTPVTGDSWSFSSTLPLMDYTLLITPIDWPSPPPGWLPRQLLMAVGGDTEPLVFEGPVGLLPHRASAYLPYIGVGD
jgi:hypothetical protein